VNGFRFALPILPLIFGVLYFAGLLLIVLPWLQLIG
jgi:hypothetical protein